MRGIAAIAGAALLGSALSACSDGAVRPDPVAAESSTRSTSAAEVADVGVDISGFAFLPKSVRVGVGGAITWTNSDDAVHSVVAGDRSTFASDVMNAGDTFSFTPTAAGVIPYICGVHQYMTGEIFVS